MDIIIRSIKVNASRLDAQKIKLILFLITLTMFVLAAGAPGTPGGPGG